MLCSTLYLMAAQLEGFAIPYSSRKRMAKCSFARGEGD
jgi:hypothetical protein